MSTLEDRLAGALRKVMDNDCPLRDSNDAELVDFWESERGEGRGEAADMLEALSALAEYESRQAKSGPCVREVTDMDEAVALDAYLDHDFRMNVSTPGLRAALNSFRDRLMEGEG